MGLTAERKERWAGELGQSSSQNKRVPVSEILALMGQCRRPGGVGVEWAWSPLSLFLLVSLPLSSSQRTVIVIGCHQERDGLLHPKFRGSLDVALRLLVLRRVCPMPGAAADPASAQCFWFRS